MLIYKNIVWLVSRTILERGADDGFWSLEVDKINSAQKVNVFKYLQMLNIYYTKFLNTKANLGAVYSYPDLCDLDQHRFRGNPKYAGAAVLGNFEWKIYSICKVLCAFERFERETVRTEHPNPCHRAWIGAWLGALHGNGSDDRAAELCRNVSGENVNGALCKCVVWNSHNCLLMYQTSRSNLSFLTL